VGDEIRVNIAQAQAGLSADDLDVAVRVAPNVDAP
jgi:hypothetical protein